MSVPGTTQKRRALGVMSAAALSGLRTRWRAVGMPQPALNDAGRHHRISHSLLQGRGNRPTFAPGAQKRSLYWAAVFFIIALIWTRICSVFSHTRYLAVGSLKARDVEEVRHLCAFAPRTEIDVGRGISDMARPMRNAREEDNNKPHWIIPTC